MFCFLRRSFYFLKDRSIISDIIKNRKETILKSLQEAESKFAEAEENLLFAKKNFEIAKVKAEEIRVQGSILSSQTVKSMLDSIEDDIKRLKSSNLSIIKLEEEKSVNEICQKLSQFALLKAVEKLNKKINSNFHKKFVSQNIEKLSPRLLGRK